MFNCRSISARLSELKLHIYKERPHIVCLTETWLFNENCPNFINYRSFWKNRTTGRGGGIGTLIRSDIVTMPSDLTDFQDNLEVQKIKIKLKNSNLEILNCYNPSNQTDTQIFNNYFNQTEGNYLILGDFNAHHQLWSLPHAIENTAGKSIANILIERNDIALASPPRLATYMHSVGGKESVLDLCFCSANLLQIIDVTQGPALGSDHYLMNVGLNLKPIIQPIKIRQKYKTSDKTIDWTVWKENLPELILPENFNIEDLNDKFSESIKSSTYKIKKTSGLLNPKFNKSWWDTDCARLVRIREQTKNYFKKHPTEQNFRKFREAENNAKDQIKESKQKSWEEYVSSITFRTGTSAVWNKIKKFSNKFNMQNNVIINNNNIYTDPHMKAEIFADYLYDKFNTKGRIINNSRNLSIQNEICKDENELYNREFTMKELKQSVKKLKATSPGIDLIDNVMLKNLPETYYNYLLQIFNYSWSCEILPEKWKISLLCPIPKGKENQNAVESYRPISMLSCIGKLMERLVYTRLNYHIETRNMLLESQAGFRKKRSVHDQLTCLESEIRTSLQNKEFLVVTFLDMESAFDKVDHTSILYKLSKMGISGHLLGWIHSYLNDRKFEVMFEGGQSVTRKITRGVPQGGILSPLLFNVLLSDIPEVRGVKQSIFADDLAFYTRSKNPDDAIQRQQIQLDKLSEWATEWGQSFSLKKKTKVLYFAHSNELRPLNKLKLYGRDITIEDKHIFLGMLFDSPYLTWETHINKLKFDCNKRTNILKSIAHKHWGSDRQTMLILYKSLIRSKLDFGSHLYGTASSRILSSLETVQNQCLRICTGLKHTTPIIALQVESCTPSLYLRRQEIGFKYISRILESSSEAPVVKIYRSNTCKTNFFGRSKTKINEWEIISPSTNYTNACSPVPPWETIEDYVKSDFPCFSIKTSTNQQIIEMFLSLKETHYTNYIDVYTEWQQNRKCNQFCNIYSFW